MFDSADWMARFGDPGYAYHAAAARVGAVMLLRLANADVVPYDYVEYARTVRRQAPEPPYHCLPAARRHTAFSCRRPAM